MEIQTDRHTDR